MRAKLNIFSAILASVALVFGSTLAPAQAATFSTNISLSNGSLAGSSINGADPTATLQLTVIASIGEVHWSNGGSGATLVSRTGDTAPVLSLQGTQDQLNAALAEISVIAPCTNGVQNISIQATTGTDILDPDTGHVFRYVESDWSWEDTKAADAATPLVVGGNDTFGYMSSIGSAVENAIVASLNRDQIWLPASDAASEGAWRWTTGPEAGQLFYQGAYPSGASVNGLYNNWNGGEPNNSGNGENYGVMNKDGTWNDADKTNLTMPSVIEFGGMPGDATGQADIAWDDTNITATTGFDQTGTQADPYLISTAKFLGDVSRCGSPTTYYKQTADITLPADWSGDQMFMGHYDGDNKKIAFSPNTVVTHDNFGLWADNQNEATLVNLDVSGDLDAGAFSNVGLLFDYSSATISDSKFSGSITTLGGNWNIGGVIARGSGLINNVESTLNITSSGGAGQVGGLVGYFYGTIEHSSWSGSINLGRESGYVGGLVGTTDCMTLRTSSASGSISVGSWSDNVGGAVGFLCGEATDSVARVDITGYSDTVGGFAGWTNAQIARVAAYGSVSGTGEVGGLFGWGEWGSATDVVAHGRASNNSNVAASLFGQLKSFTVTNAYATGSILADSGRGGALGQAEDVTLSNMHWNPEEAGAGITSGFLPGEVPFSTAEETSFALYQNEGWNISEQWSDAATWTICTGVDDHKPFLTSLFSSDPCFKNFANSTTPVISGNGWVGNSLGIDLGNWDSGVAFSYQWKLDGANIPDATASTYTPVEGEIGKTVTVEITGTKQGFLDATKLSSNAVLITAVPVDAVEKSSTAEVVIGEFAGNSWWIPVGFVSSIKSAVKSHHKATTLTCTGIVAAGGTKTWLKTLGLKRAVLACSIATGFNAKLKTKLAWRVSKKSDKVRRGAALKFNK